ncbi:MAG: ATPase [Pseudomonadota bacterium]
MNKPNQSNQAFKNPPITLMGMSGVGKTYNTLRLFEGKKCFHYSCDVEIGCVALQDEIVDSIRRDIMAQPGLRAYLESGAIKINNNITVENLETLSAYVGKIGNPTQGRLGKTSHGGYSLEEFKRRQKEYYKAECDVLLDLESQIKKAQKNNYEHFINDTTGSICEIEDEDVLDFVAKHTTIVYIKATYEEEQEVIRRSIKYPKPLYYPKSRFDIWLDEYLETNGLQSSEEMEPDEFSRWVFPRLFRERQPKYQRVADRYGVTISSDELKKAKTPTEFYALIDNKKI